ncbi:hypothetical protein BST61_g6631 [Cercospora zeina]
MMENAINGHSAISAALACGTCKPNSALLVEPAQCNVDAEGFIEAIWPHPFDGQTVKPSPACLHAGLCGPRQP